MDQGAAIAIPAIVAVHENRISASTKGNFPAGQLEITKNLLKPVASMPVGEIEPNVHLAWLAMILAIFNRGPVRSPVITCFSIREVKR